MTKSLLLIARAVRLHCWCCLWSLALHSLALDHSLATSSSADHELMAQVQQWPRDVRWPDKQLNLLIDAKSLNASEREIINQILASIERKTCVKINQLASDQINPFDPNNEHLLKLGPIERNFVYVFKSPQFGAYNSHPSIGLSSLGCVRQGRQSLVLTDLAFKWPELVLRYHLMRTLGVDNLERPDGQVRRLLNMLPLSQKISSDDYVGRQSNFATDRQHQQGAGDSSADSLFFPLQTLFAYSSARRQLASARSESPPAVAGADPMVGQRSKQPEVGYLHSDDFEKIKQLYECSELQSRSTSAPAPSADPNTDAPETEEPTSNNIIDHNPDLYSSQQQTGPTTPMPLDNLQRKLGEAQDSLKEVILAAEQGHGDKVNDTLIDEAAKHIVDYLILDASSQNTNLELPAAQAPEIGPNAEPMVVVSSTTPMSACDMSAGDPTNSACLNDASLTNDNPKSIERHERSTTNQPGDKLQERPMLLKLDEHHAQDAQLQQANQMKLSQLNSDALSSYSGQDFDWSSWNQQQSNNQNFARPNSGSKSEMLISFEQANAQPGAGPLASLASSQVLKLCSCSCQTMTPNGQQQQQQQQLVTPSSPQVPPPPPPATQPTKLPYETSADLNNTSIRGDDLNDDYANGRTPSATSVRPPYEREPQTERPLVPSQPQDWTTLQPIVGPLAPTVSPAPEVVTTGATTQTPASSTLMPPEPPTTTSATQTPPVTSQELPTTSAANFSDQITTSRPATILGAANYCDLVEWVAPNKTVYASARIVWDVDRANRNYFLCNNLVNGEIVPGKTHGLSCKVSNEGKAYELHSFNVLTKPEHVNLAWVQRTSDSFGKTNFPVIGGFSKGQDPYIVSRCLVRDENNDVLTLIGYVNNKGVGWFPFDDIQIECAQYDVLACIN